MPKAVTKTITRVAIAAATGGVSEAVKSGQAAAKGDVKGALLNIAGGGGAGVVATSLIEGKDAKDAPQGVVDVVPKDQAGTELKKEQEAAFQERRRRALLQKQGSLIRTSPLGAAIRDSSNLGGPKLMGY